MSSHPYNGAIRKLRRMGLLGKNNPNYQDCANLICDSRGWPRVSGRDSAKDVCVRFLAKTAKPEPKRIPYAQWQAQQKAFYLSREWRELRYEALRRCGAQCCLCGRTRNHGIVLHVDHIKPISKFPDLRLDINNLQVLCEECNMGKSNKDDTDWR